MTRAYAMAGMVAGRVARLLWRYGVSVRYLPRVLFVLQAGLWASVLAWLRRRRERRSGAPAARAPSDPVIIVSHWRTGTTYLHRLLALDPDSVCPDMYQVTLPEGFEAGERHVRPLMRRLLRGKRPMDEVPLGADEPQEEEYALFKLCGLSPLVRLCFPEDRRYFLLENNSFLPHDDDGRRCWRAAVLEFVARVRGTSRRRVVLKNPFHGPRIAELLRLFPEARLVHIERDPLVVVPSTLRMWTIACRLNALRAPAGAPTLEEVVAVYARVTGQIERALAGLPPGRVGRVRFEDLERDPAGTVRDLYRQLDLPFSAELRARIDAFCRANRGYRKNRYDLTEEQRETILRGLAGAGEEAA